MNVLNPVEPGAVCTFVSICFLAAALVLWRYTKISRVKERRGFEVKPVVQQEKQKE